MYNRRNFMTLPIMLEARGLVVDTNGEFVQVAIQPASCCRREVNTPCNSVCMNRAMFQMFTPRRMPLNLKSQDIFECGELVRIAIHEDVLLHGIFRLYLLPIISLLLAALSVALLMWAKLLPHSESLIIVGGLAGLAVGFWRSGQHTGTLSANADKLLILKEHTALVHQPRPNATQANTHLRD